MKHGYGLYARGCRCEACRTAKAAYMRKRRAASRQARWLAEEAGGDYVPYLRHGISGYQDSACRCQICCAAKARASAREYRRKGAA